MKHADCLCWTMQASNITSLVSLEGQVAVLQKAHAMLSAHLELDTWAQIWAEADGQQAFDAFSGRMAHCITVQVLTDLLPNFGYCEPTQRFTRLVGSPQNSNTSCTQTVTPDVPVQLHQLYLYGTINFAWMLAPA